MAKKKKEPDPSLLFPHNPGQDFFGPEDWVAIADALNISLKELAVAVLIFEGKTRDNIARRMNLSVSTVREHLDRLHRKLNVHDRVGFVIRLVRVHQMISSR